MRAHAVIGANYGDEGKGIITDYLCSTLRPDACIRFNGGAQAGHTVMANGRRRVFHHISCGHESATPTFLSKFFLVNPEMLKQEVTTAHRLYIDPRAEITTPLDMIVNQALAKDRNVSCGVGINETMQRVKAGVGLPVDTKGLVSCKDVHEYYEARIKELGLDLSIDPAWMVKFGESLISMYRRAILTTKPWGDNFVFEGAQGLLLDQNSPDFPFVTHSNTGSKNVLSLCDEWGIDDVHLTYVTRTYLTRHGKGPLPNEAPLPSWLKDETNINNEWQGPLRYAPLDVLALEKRVIADAKGVDLDLAITCIDQCPLDVSRLSIPVGYASSGPRREDVSKLPVFSEPMRL